MILINGLSPTLDLGIEWEDDVLKAVMLCTAINEEIVLLGNMRMTAENLSKIKSYNWRYLVKPADGRWTPKELDWSSIPRHNEVTTELIKIQLKRGDEDEDGIVF